MFLDKYKGVRVFLLITLALLLWGCSSTIDEEQAEARVEAFIKTSDIYPEGYCHVLAIHSDSYEVGCYMNTDGEYYYGLYATFSVSKDGETIKEIE